MGRPRRARARLSVAESAGKKHSMRSSWSVTSWGVPSVVTVEKKSSARSPLRNCTGRTGTGATERSGVRQDRARPDRRGPPRAGASLARPARRPPPRGGRAGSAPRPRPPSSPRRAAASRDGTSGAARWRVSARRARSSRRPKKRCAAVGQAQMSSADPSPPPGRAPAVRGCDRGRGVPGPAPARRGRCSAVDGREAGREQQARCARAAARRGHAASIRTISRLGLAAPGLEEAEVAGRNAGVERQGELALAPLATPVLEQSADAARAAGCVRFGKARTSSPLGSIRTRSGRSITCEEIEAMTPAADHVSRTLARPTPKAGSRVERRSREPVSAPYRRFRSRRFPPPPRSPGPGRWASSPTSPP